MTLVLSASLSGQVAFMTSDTRVVQAKYDGDKRDYNEPLIVCDDKSTKTHKLNDLILLGAGGIAELSTHLAEILKREVEPEHNLADCKSILEGVIAQERAREDGPAFLRFLNIDEGVSVILNGFYSDGSTGLVTFKAGKDAAVEEVKADGYQYALIAPAKEYLRRTEDVFNIPKLNDEATFEGLSAADTGQIVFDTLLEHLIMVHGVTSYNHPVEISSDFEVHIIAYENGNPQYSMSRFDLTETHKLYAELEKKIV
jgi:hypothetical protein